MTSQNDLLDKGQESAEDESRTGTEPPLETTLADMETDTMNQVNRARDHIAQAYLGLWGGTAVQEKSRRRLHWIAEQVQGRRVLDIGCSEGMLAILLAREGFEITGIDVNPDALDYARELLANEHDFVRERVTFRLSDGIEADFEPDSFDTVILGEVIEHLTRPDQMIERAVGYLKPGGVLIVTTPFGYFPDPDHRQTFVLTDMVRLLENLCAPDHISVMDGYIRFTGLKSTPDPKDWKRIQNQVLLETTEKAAVDQQTLLRSHIDMHKQGKDKLDKQLKDLQARSQEEQKRLKGEIAQIRESLEKSRKTNEELTRQSREQTEKFNTESKRLQSELDNSGVNLEKITLERDGLERRLGEETDRFQDEHAKLSNELSELNRKYESVLADYQKQAEILVSVEEAARAQLEAFHELNKEHQQQQLERQELQSEIDRLRAEAGYLNESLAKIREEHVELELAKRRLEQTLQDAQRQLLDAESKLDPLTGQLRDAHHKIHTLEASREKGALESNRRKNEARRLQFECEALQKRAYTSMLRSEEVEETISYQLGIAITQFAAKPGLRTFRSMARQMGTFWRRGRRMLNQQADPTVASIQLELPDGCSRKLDLTCVARDCISFVDDTLHFDVPEPKTLRLLSKETTRIFTMPFKPIITLEPNQPYTLSGEVRLQGEGARCHCVEYGSHGLLTGHVFAMGNGKWQVNWTTDEQHQSFALVFEVWGKGSLKLNGLKLTRLKTGHGQVDDCLINPGHDGEGMVRLTRTPASFRVKVTPGFITILRGALQFTDEADRKTGYALARVEYRNIEGSLIEGPYEQISESPAIGHYKYLRLFPAGNGKGELLRIHPPAEAAEVSLGFQTWKAARPVLISNRLEVEQKTVWSFPCFERPAPRPEGKPLVASILDTFSEACFRYEMNLLPLTLDNWRNELAEQKPVMLLAESAWQGNGGLWKGQMTNFTNHENNELRQMLAHCRETGLPTVFWNKEDPPNFDVFIDVAKEFDHIFTTAEECIPRYREACGHDRVHALPFAAQPAIHNPIGKQESDNFDVAFAGTWYKNKHKERCEFLPMVLDPATDYRLYIFDRMSDWFLDDSYEFPARYQPFLQPKVAYDEMLNLHRVFKVFLNTNSVFDSPTMFSRRVFEILASSTPVVSTASVGIEQMFDGIVPVVKDKAEAERALAGLLKDEWNRKKTGHMGYRRVMTEHTFETRVNEMYRKVGMETLVREQDYPKVTLAIPTNRPENLKYIKENFERQNYPNMELIVILNSDDYNLAEVQAQFAGQDNVKVFQLPESCTLGECLNYSVDHATGDYWAKLDDDNIYCEDFIGDLLLPYRFCNSEIVGKGTYYIYLEGMDILALRFPGNEHRYVDFMSGSAMAVRRDVFERVRFPDVSVGEDTQFMKDCLAQGMRMYSADAFNYVVVRKADLGIHTWKIKEEELLKTCRKVCGGLDLSFVRC